ncbi:Epoxide hydrolase domain protein [Mycena venus]|uniref:Epoxide hydrolase domain protein n=1 Tax=Mycena venus TaxID=2733690 RepID=A0A8H6XGL7_9AGAR|nr:Epoxide hydrolase domain protein [Mycena venus]
MVSLLCLVALLFPLSATSSAGFDVQPFRVDLGHEVAHMKALVQNTRLPDKPLYPEASIEFGMELDVLRDLQTKWLNDYDWAKQEATLNELPQFTVTIEGQSVHFVHAKSEEPDAIPMLLLHGWSGSFQEFLPVVKPLTQSWTSPNGTRISFDVIVPSLPGFIFSSPPPQNWTNADTARIFNKLMVNVLGYSTYSLHGTDWGSSVGYILYSTFNTTVRAAHFNLLPFIAPDPQSLNITLTDIEKVTVQRSLDFRATGLAYNMEQAFKPNTIGLALYDNPIGQLSWIGSNILLCKVRPPALGPRPRCSPTRPSLTMVSLYTLTHTFQSSVWIYEQNPNGFSADYVKPATDAPMGYSLFEYELQFTPRDYVEKVAGKLVSYKEHDFGGHFAGLDNPPALVEDLRELGLYFGS